MKAAEEGGVSYSEYKSKDLLKELMSSKSLFTGGEMKGGASSAGSDDDPSGDNMGDDEIIRILPSKAKKKFQQERREK